MNNAAFDYLSPTDRSDDGRYTSSGSPINNGPAANSIYNSDTSPTAQTENENLHSTALTRIPAEDGYVNASFLNANQATVQRADPLPREKRTRKGHKKSRAGCYSCKKGKIKCPENQPACHNCTRRNMECIYPTLENLTGLHSSAIYRSNPIPSVSLQSTPAAFTLTDMRLFHHYLMHSYPHLPVGNETAWLHQVPLVAHRHGLFVERITAVKQSALFGYSKFIHLYKDLSNLDNVSFKDLTDPANHVSKILIAYFLAIQLTMLPIMAREWEGRIRTTPIRPSLDCISSISSSVPPHMRPYVEWPKAIADTVRDELAGKLPAASGHLVLRKNEGLSRDIV